ncbi:YbhB/YbcL family Raf kinase inhibitor-like protein [Candidatus Pacearchaeota archaeon]|nr:YbhB/YbcL family Raf kinase inhibitor-like protein [Candidatus Pacearchaeota archaeon]
MNIKSNFNENEVIDRKYTCDGQDVNPPLEIIDPPVGCKSFALIVDDPDAPVGEWVHWILINIPFDVRRIEENSVPDGAILGLNDFGKNEYGGPCPPSGEHRYFFKLFALDCELDLITGFKKSDVMNEIEGHVLDKAELVGVFSRGIE